ncbi:MAG: endonuclease/exonuclease/phosphatase family protein [Verrucomicrobiota bacterium]
MKKTVFCIATFLLSAILISSASGSAFTLMTYNVKGNGVADWSTNAAQVKAIGRQLMYLQPDIVTFNEIPHTNMWQMPNWVVAFLPGYNWATNSIGDGYIQSCILSRYPIRSSTSRLHGSSLTPYGYSGSGFTRDLFEAVISVTNFPQPLHVFVVHLKATSSSAQDDANKRAAEASAVSNYFARVFLQSANGLHPYVLDGDMNEDIFRPGGNYTSGQPIQRLVSSLTGLQLTTPTNPYTASDMTISIQTSLSARFDYILPCTLLFSNIQSSQVFRTDLLSPLPPNLFSYDDTTASDHLPVVMVFNNPYTQPFRLTSITRTNPSVALQWESVPGQIYNLENSSDLDNWLPLATNLFSSGYNFTYSTNLTSDAKYFRVYITP